MDDTDVSFAVNSFVSRSRATVSATGYRIA